MTFECVIDAELLKKYSFDNKYNSIYEAAELLLKQGHVDISFLEEMICLVDSLKAIRQKKCIIYVNHEILKEYITYIDKMPEELREIFVYILSDANKVRRIEGSLEYDYLNKLRSTGLKQKLMYLDVANSLNNKIIVSTKEDIKNTYNPNRVILLMSNISVIDVCTLKENLIFKEGLH